MRAILICPNDKLRKQFEAAVAPHRSLYISRTMDVYPSPEDLRKIVRAWAPEAIFLNIESAAIAETIALQLESEFPAVQRVALHASQHASVYRRVLRLRMNQLLSAPFASEEVGQVLEQLARDLETRPASINSTDRFYAFMPAKAGGGGFDPGCQCHLGV